MNCSKHYYLAAAALLSTFVWVAPQTLAAQSTTCTNASIKGKYGLLITGYDSSGLYQMGVGEISSNGAGTLSGVETVSDDGTIYKNETTTGTYSVSADCTGSGTIINVKNGNQSHYNFVVDPEGKQVEAAGTDSGHGTASGYALAVGAATCSTAAIAGTYGFHGGGDLVSQGVVAFDGQYVLDGAGNLTGVKTESVGGVITSAAAITGTYTMASSCLGTITYQFNGATENFNMVMVSSGKEFFTIETDAGTVTTAVAHQ
jgi:hypothetical protein